MASQVTLPRLGQGMESGTIVRWLKAEGDTVEKGEPLYELDTEKVTQEVEADASGVLLKIAVSEVGGESPAAPAAEATTAEEEEEQEEGSPGAARAEDRERGRRASTEFAER